MYNNFVKHLWTNYRSGIAGVYLASCISYLLFPTILVKDYVPDIFVIILGLGLVFLLTLLFETMVISIKVLYPRTEIILSSFWLSFFFVITQVYITNNIDTMSERIISSLPIYTLKKLIVEISVLLFFSISIVIFSMIPVIFRKYIRHVN